MMEKDKATRFGLIRHAQTVWNRDKKIQGHSDTPLTPAGEQQAENWGRLLMPFPWDRILASDIGRALTTAERINGKLKLPLETEPRIREQNWGRWVGKTVQQIRLDAGQELEKQIHAGWDFCPPGGEPRHGVLKRSRAALLDVARRYPGETILVVCHEGVVKSLIYDLYGRNYLPDEAAILKGYRLHWLVSKSGGLQIEQINALSLGS